MKKKQDKLNNIKTLTFYIKNTGQNTFISLFKEKMMITKNAISSSSYQLLKTYSCGLIGFKNRKKETPFACSILANKSALYALEQGARYIHIIFKGIHIFKKIILSTILNSKFNNTSLKILSITNITSYPYNGCRAKKVKKR